MNNLPSIHSYGQYSSSNYGAHTLCVQVGAISLWFSYQTVVAFSSGFSGRFVSENVWSVTTGKHLNWIDGGNKAERVNNQVFDEEFNKVLDHYGLIE